MAAHKPTTKKRVPGVGKRIALRLRTMAAWFAGNRSDLAIYIVILILVNVAAASWFFRADLTRDDLYSLSPVSRELLREVQEPLSIKVFFSSDLPAPYNSAERYLKDLLEEYQRVAGPGFSVEYHDMEEPESKSRAQDYGLRPVQIQEIKSDQFQSRNAFMGLALVYGDAIETIDQLTGSAGMEYRITTTVRRMISSVNALHGLTGTPELRLYASESLKQFDIRGLDELENYAASAAESLSKQLDREINFRRIDPSPAEIDQAKAQYGIQVVNWQAGRDQAGNFQAAGKGALDLLLVYGEKARVIPVGLAQQLFGGYAVTGVDNLESRIDESMKALLSNNPAVGYLAGFGTHSLKDAQQGAAGLQQLLSDMYDIRELTPPAPQSSPGGSPDSDLAGNTQDDGAFTIPDDVQTVIINGPKELVSEEVRYALDQFLLRGGSLVFFVDPLQVPQQAQMNQYQQPQFLPIRTGFEEQLAHYGVELDTGYVMDTECYTQQDPQYGELELFWVPVLSRDSLSDKNPVSRGLGDFITLQNGKVSPAEWTADSDKVQATVLLRSSNRGWFQKENIQLNPMMLMPPAEEELSSIPLAVVLEGSFSSAFDGPPAGAAGAADAAGADDARGGESAGDVATGEGTSLTGSSYIPESAAPGRIAVVGTSMITTPQLLDPNSNNSNSAFLHNLVDWASDNEEVIPMRSKGLGRSRLAETTPEMRNLIKGFAMALLPILVILAGIIVWRSQRARQEKLRRRFNESLSGGVDHE